MLLITSDPNTDLLLLIIGVIFFIWVFPVLHILFSRKVSGSEKLAWLLAVFFISWFAYVFFLLLAPLKRRS